MRAPACLPACKRRCRTRMNPSYTTGHGKRAVSMPPVDPRSIHRTRGDGKTSRPNRRGGSLVTASSPATLTLRRSIGGPLLLRWWMHVGRCTCGGVPNGPHPAPEALVAPTVKSSAISGASAVADRVLLLWRQLRHGSLLARWHEDRVVTEPVRAARLRHQPTDDLAGHDALYCRARRPRSADP